MKKLLLVSLAVACSVDAPEESTIESAELRRCSVLVCGENAARLGDDLVFDEIDLFGQENYAGVRLIGGSIEAGGVRIPTLVWIWLDELYMVDTATWTAYMGYQLVTGRARMYFAHGSERIDLEVRAYEAKLEKFRSGEDEYVPVYQFAAARSSVPEVFSPICAEGEPGPPWAVVFRGDKYAPNLKVVPNDPSNGWSFIACNGSAAMKMHLQRHTYASQFDDAYVLAYPTDDSKRTTLLKAITADYCGNGHSFTVTGTRLAFATSQDPARFPEPYAPADIVQIEALWTPYGAACLDKLRLAERFEVDAMCSIPACGIGSGVAPPGWASAYHAITAVPDPLP